MPCHNAVDPPGSMFSFSDTEFMEGVKFAFWTVYAGMVTITAALFIGIFIKPQVSGMPSCGHSPAGFCHGGSLKSTR